MVLLFCSPISLAAHLIQIPFLGAMFLATCLRFAASGCKFPFSKRLRVTAEGAGAHCYRLGLNPCAELLVARQPLARPTPQLRPATTFLNFHCEFTPTSDSAVNLQLLSPSPSSLYYFDRGRKLNPSNPPLFKNLNSHTFSSFPFNR